jgi:hypothetical protein
VKKQLPKGIRWWVPGSADRLKKSNNILRSHREIRVSFLPQLRDDGFYQNTSRGSKLNLPCNFFLSGTMTIPIRHQKTT